MPVAVSIQQLHKRFGELKALNGVDLKIAEGELFGLLGPNGAGKSTLIGIMAGLCRADSGVVTVMGKDVVRDAAASRRNLGVVPRNCCLIRFLKFVKCYRSRLVISEWIGDTEPGLTSCSSRWGLPIKPTRTCVHCPVV